MVKRFVQSGMLSASFPLFTTLNFLSAFSVDFTLFKWFCVPPFKLQFDHFSGFCHKSRYCNCSVTLS